MLEVFHAIEQHDLARLARLLSDGADPHLEHPTQPSWTPLKAAVEEVGEGGPIEAVVLLLHYGAEVDGGRVPGNATPLIVAAQNGQEEAARILLAAGADPNASDDEGDTPLKLSIQQNTPQLTTLLLLCGAREMG